MTSGKQTIVFSAEPSHVMQLCIACSCLDFWVDFVVWTFYKALNDSKKYVNTILQKCLGLNTE